MYKMKDLPSLRAGKWCLANPFLCLLVAVAAMLISGCAAVNGYPDRSGNTKVELKQLNIYYQTNVLDTYNGKQGDDRKHYRDDVVNGRIRATDIHFNDFERALAKSSVFKNIGVDWSVLALNAARGDCARCKFKDNFLPAFPGRPGGSQWFGG